MILRTIPFCIIGQSPICSVKIAFLVLFILVAVLTACSSQPEEPDPFDDPKYEGWKVYTYQNVKILYQPGHPQEAGFEQVAAGYVRAMAGVSEMLNMPVPDDTIRVIFYTGWGQGREMTGQQASFVEDGVIHFWVPSHLGVTFMHWFLPHWVPTGPAHEFLWHGLVTLFDYSGYDYHKMTLDYIENGRFIPLADLAVDSTIDSNTERLQSAEAASFVAFALAWYGPDQLKMLYRTDIPFDRLVRDSLFVTVDSLQNQWINVIRANQPVDTTLSDTTSAESTVTDTAAGDTSNLD
jgi:hypothetical protein